ncbi:NmrA family NAD(P)-binding protein [Asanoa sp. WMMD1127]|uniref:NAD(P)H-binding protein n=1 Tax=Asanoa sp. WMMD1127 TaxID=3016107 RepID=UPI002415A05A|nr:NmrA family NAD(P)-binding protein [Asanoa sp. WMMD1127]MDG4825710.1 NmrA family NAD(P)-binding protein [Asanoa sp. WMMD1127]
MRIAVTGGTGRVGGRVVELLTATGGHEVVALSSRTAPYDDPGALRAALDGVDTLVFVSSDGEAARVVVHHRNVLAAAADRGVRHVVQLSGLDVALESPFCYAFTNGDTERLLRAGGQPHSVVRAGLYTEFVLDLMRQVAAGTGSVALPAAADDRVSLVARDDVAACLAALALGEPTDSHHDVTGPASLTMAEVATAAGYAYAETSPAEFAAALGRLGEEQWWIYAYASMFASVRQGRWAATGDAVEKLTGRPPIALA